MLSRLPFLLFVLFACMLCAFLYLKSPPVESALIGSALPAHTLPLWKGTESEAASPAEPSLYNLFASWCTPCISELSVLAQLKQTTGITIIGIDWKDKPENLNKWLERYGDPYDRIYLDSDGAYGIALGIRGLPETYLVDGSGTIRYHHIGPLTEADLPALQAAIEMMQ